MPTQRSSLFHLDRRAFLGALAAGGGLMVAGTAGASQLAGYGGRQIAFDIRRDGSPIGLHEVRFRRNGDQLEVDVSIDISLSFAFITVFSYRHRNHEVWQDGRLVSLESETDDDGEEFRVSARRLGDGLWVNGAEGEFLAPAGILPTSYWHPRTVEQRRLLDSQHGRVLEVSPAFLGRETLAGDMAARRYRLSGDLDLDLWYSDSGEWLKTAFEARGAEVSYALRRNGGAAG